MFGLRPILAALPFIVAAGGIGFGVVQTLRLEKEQAESMARGIELVACGARLDNVRRDLYRDTNIDNIPDDALRAVPPHWLRTPED